MSPGIDYDGAWKEALELYLRPLLGLCFPAVAGKIDWNTPIEFLDKELQEIVRDADLGKQRVDKLVKVRRLDGEEEWVLLHLEVQAQPDDGLPLRLYQYHHRIVDRFGRRAVTLTILADEDKDWHPTCYEENLWGCRVRFEYPVGKLRELSEATLEQATASKNPAAVVIAAHLATQTTSGQPESRQQLKWRLTRRLYELKYGKKDILELYRLIDWLMVLPNKLEVEFRKKVVKYEKENRMPYVTSIERCGLEKGLKKGRQEGRIETMQQDVLEALEIRFEQVPEGLREAVRAIVDASKLRDLFRAAIRSTDIEGFSKALSRKNSRSNLGTQG